MLGSLRRLAVAASLGALATPSTAAAQDCISSPGGRFSYAMDRMEVDRCVGPHAELRLYAGPSCDPAAEVGHATVRTTRLRLTDGGVVVSILGRRVRRREWSIVELRVPRPEGGERVRLSLDELPGTGVLTGTIEVRLEDGGIRFTGRDAELVVPFASLDALATRPDR